MEYSIKRAIKNDGRANDLFRTIIFCFSVFILLSGILLIITVYNDFNLNSVVDVILKWKILLVFLFIPVFFFFIMLFIILLLRRLHFIKIFFENSSAKDVRIEEFQPYINEKGYKDGFVASFSYMRNNEDNFVIYYFPDNKRFKPLRDKYSQIGETVRIFVRKDDPCKIMIKEVFKD